jgi:hypothetical protein
VKDTCKRGNKLSDSIKCEEFFGSVMNNQLFKKGFGPTRYMATESATCKF